MKNKNFIEAVKHAIDGVITGVKTQVNLRRQLIIAVIVIIICIFLKLTYVEFMILAISISLVIATELINTAIEFCVDLCTMKYHEKAKAAKDVAAGAVLIASLNAIIIAAFLILSKIN